MYNQPYFIPSYYANMSTPSMMRGAMNGAMMGARGASRGMGLFGRIGSGIASLRSLNWGGFINNASKTLGIINQTIPLVRQAGPMFHNMRSMLRVASIFKDETDQKTSKRKDASVKSSGHYSDTYHNHDVQTSNQRQSSNFYSSNQDYKPSSLNEENEGSPTFFIQ